MYFMTEKERPSQSAQGANEMHQFKSGAKSTVQKPRYDLVPPEAVRYIAERFGFGAKSHGPRNWEKGICDDEFFTDRKNHAVEHLLNYVNGVTTVDPGRNRVDTPLDHLKAAITNLAMLAAIEERRAAGACHVEPEPVEEPVVDDRESKARMVLDYIRSIASR